MDPGHWPLPASNLLHPQNLRGSSLDQTIDPLLLNVHWAFHKLFYNCFYFQIDTFVPSVFGLIALRNIISENPFSWFISWLGIGCKLPSILPNLTRLLACHGCCYTFQRYQGLSVKSFADGIHCLHDHTGPKALHKWRKWNFAGDGVAV